MLKKPKPSQKGLKKLPTAVRNKMGYMKDGGMTGRATVQGTRSSLVKKKPKVLPRRPKATFKDVLGPRPAPGKSGKSTPIHRDPRMMSSGGKVKK